MKEDQAETGAYVLSIMRDKEINPSSNFIDTTVTYNGCFISSCLSLIRYIEVYECVLFLYLVISYEISYVGKEDSCSCKFMKHIVLWA